MEFSEVFKNSLKYPTLDLKNFALFAVLMGVNSIIITIGSYFASSAISSVVYIFYFVLMFIISGYVVTNIKHSIDLKEGLPDLDLQRDVILGIKYVIASIVYSIIPIIIIVIAAFYSGAFEVIGEILKIYSVNPQATISDATAINLFVSLSLVLIVGVIVGFITAMFFVVGIARLAKFESLKESLSIVKVGKDMKKIGISYLFAYLIVMFIIVFILSSIAIFVSLIPVVGSVVGAFVTSFIIAPYNNLFMSRVTGLIYSDVSE